MTAKELVAAARRLSESLTSEEKARLFKQAMDSAREKDEERAQSHKVTREVLERAYSL